jgi:hypothetical protein
VHKFIKIAIAVFAHGAVAIHVLTVHVDTLDAFAASWELVDHVEEMVGKFVIHSAHAAE